jgi:hypothetical protein
MLAALQRTARVLEKVSGSNPKRSQIIRRSFGVLSLHVIGASTLRSARDAAEIPAASKVAN